MKEYKAPQTRIKVVEQGGVTHYYSEYKQVIIPYLWWEWNNIHIGIVEFSIKIEDAKSNIDTFLSNCERYYYERLEEEKVKRAKISVSYLDYP